MKVPTTIRREKDEQMGTVGQCRDEWKLNYIPLQFVVICAVASLRRR
jgi:hypothetical protein